MELTSAITPPSLLGIDRRMAYANKKYHSGWICTGVTRGLAGMKFSESPNAYGLIRHNIEIAQIIIKNPAVSLNEKNGWNGILSTLEVSPNGLFDPVWWRNSKCTRVNAATTKGKRK